MAGKLDRLIEDLRILTLDPPWSSFVRLMRMVDSVQFSPELDKLDNDELRAIKGFCLTLHRAAEMEPETMKLHVAAHWMGAVDQAVRKLSIGEDAVRAMTELMKGEAPMYKGILA